LRAARFNRRMINACLRANAQYEPLRPGQLHCAIIGAGATGVELAAELHKSMRDLASYNLDHIDFDMYIKIDLIEAAPRILPALPESLATATADALRKLGVNIRTGTRVTEVRAGEVVLGSGEIVPAELIVWAAGIKAPDFLRDLAGAVARLGLADEAVNYKLLSNAVAALPLDGRREFLLTLAKSGVVSARFAAAASAATEALESSKADSPEAMRARLYLAASRLFSDAYDAAIVDLKTLSASKLDRADAGLLAAARRVAVELRVAPDVGVVNAQDPAALSAADKDKPSEPALTIAQAEAALQRTSSLAPPQTGGSP